MRSYEQETRGESRKPSSQLNWGAWEYTKCTHTLSSDIYQLPQFTVCVKLCPSTSGVKIFPLILDNLPSYHCTMNYKLQPFQCLLPQTNFKSFFKVKWRIYCIIYEFPFLFQLESSHCLLTDQIIKIIMGGTIVHPSKKPVDLVSPVASTSAFYTMQCLSLHSTLWRR